MTSSAHRKPTSPSEAPGALPKIPGSRRFGAALYIVALAALPWVPGSAFALDPAPVMLGDTRIHDPSAIDVDGHWVTFQTGTEGGLYRGAILLKTSPDGITWTNAGAIGKGVATGATFGLVGSEVVDGYVCTVEYLAGPKATKITKVVQHAIHTTIGNKGAPQNATKAASPREAIGTVTRQAITNALLNLSTDPAFGH